MSYAAVDAAVRALWAARWVPGPTPPQVVWFDNSPLPPLTPPTVHLAVTYGAERLVAFGAGLGANERILDGFVTVRVFHKTGSGQATVLALLDAAVAVFRSQRAQGLDFLGDIDAVDALDSDGTSEARRASLWHRGAVVPFEYRLQG